MKPIHLLLFIVSVLIFNSCTKETDEMRLSGFETPVITGLYFTDSNGELLYTEGNPNVKLFNGPDEQSSTFKIRTFPNPCSANFIINFEDKNSNKKTFTVWITRATYNMQGTENWVGFNTMNTAFIGGGALLGHTFNSSYGLFDISTLPEGFYRVYVKNNDDLLYDNIVIYRPNNN